MLFAATQTKQFWLISLYVTYYAVAKLYVYVTQRFFKLREMVEKLKFLTLSSAIASSDEVFTSVHCTLYSTRDLI